MTSLLQLLLGIFLSSIFIFCIGFVILQIYIKNRLNELVEKHSFYISKKIVIGFGRKHILLFDYKNHKFALIRNYGRKISVFNFKNFVHIEEERYPLNKVCILKHVVNIVTTKRTIVLDLSNSKTEVFSNKDYAIRNKADIIKKEFLKVKTYQNSVEQIN